LPPISILVVSVIFWVSAKWLVPEKGMCSVIRILGTWLSVASLVFSFGMSCDYAFTVFYID